MATTITVSELVLTDDDGAGPAVGHAVFTLTDSTVPADAAAEGVGSKRRSVRVRLPRAAWTALLGQLRRLPTEKLAGALDAAAPIARDP